MNPTEVIQISSFSPTTRTITCKEKYKISDIASIYNATRGVLMYLPVLPTLTATVSNGYNIIFNSSINTTGWTTADEIVVKVILNSPKQNLVEIEESYLSRLLKIGKPAWYSFLNYPITESPDSTSYQPNAQKIFIPLYIHFTCNRDFEMYIRYSESSSNFNADADPYANPNNAFSQEQLIDIVLRPAGEPYQLHLHGEVRIQGNDGIKGNTGFIKPQVKTMTGQGKGLLNGIIRGIEITQTYF